MDILRGEGVVAADTLRFVRRSNRIQLRGRVLTRSGGVLVVRKALRAERDPGDPDPRVRTAYYRYMALWQPSPDESCPLFRYDNYGEDLATLHRHDFNPDGSEAERYGVPHERLPYMNEIILETEALARIRAESA